MPQDEKARWAEHAKPGPYVTNLSDEDEKDFQSWVKSNKIPWQDGPSADYDMRGFWKAAQSGDTEAKTEVNSEDHKIHYPDTYKTPYHKTFSIYSKYALPSAGRWDGNTFIPPKSHDELLRKAVGIKEDTNMAQAQKDDGGVQKKLDDAKKALAGAKNSNVSGRGTAPVSPVKAAAPAKKSGLMDALKNAAGEANKEGADIAAGLKARQKNEQDAVDSMKADDQMPKMHKGGKVEKDGAHNLQKGEVVVSKKAAAKNKGLMDALTEGRSDEPEKKSEKESEKKSGKEPEKKHKKKVKGMHIRRAKSGGFIAKHDMEMPEAGQPAGEQEEHALPDMDAVKSHIEDHMGEEAQGGQDQGAGGGAPQGGGQAQ